MKKYDSFQAAVDAGADANTLAHYVVDTVSAFTTGKAVDFDFLSQQAVGDFCDSLGISRNWAKLSMDEIAPLEGYGINMVPEPEADKILCLLAALVRDKYLKPRSSGVPVPELLNDFMSTPATFQRKKTYGQLTEFSYALGVELEHGRDRGQNVTMNHPLLTGMVVMAHLSEDTLYYARLRVMETEGDLFNSQLKKTPYKQLQQIRQRLSYARKLLAERMDEKLAAATARAPSQAGLGYVQQRFMKSRLRRGKRQWNPSPRTVNHPRL